PISFAILIVGTASGWCFRSWSGSGGLIRIAIFAVLRVTAIRSLPTYRRDLQLNILLTIAVSKPQLHLIAKQMRILFHAGERIHVEPDNAIHFLRQFFFAGLLTLIV